jgi:hypothetical protein
MTLERSLCLGKPLPKQPFLDEHRMIIAKIGADKPEFYKTKITCANSSNFKVIFDTKSIIAGILDFLKTY